LFQTLQPGLSPLHRPGHSPNLLARLLPGRQIESLLARKPLPGLNPAQQYLNLPQQIVQQPLFTQAQLFPPLHAQRPQHLA